MIVFFGLGNNESKYLLTKHNVGRVFVEKMSNNFGLVFDQSQDCMLAKSVLDNGEIAWFIYSQGYMNNSGQPLAKLLKYFKIDILDKDFQLIVAQDDSDQTSLNSKLVSGGGTAGHNGIISIYQHFQEIKDRISKLE
jgi:peptidyl-tRNA hydrolase, PTH1 family